MTKKKFSSKVKCYHIDTNYLIDFFRVKYSPKDDQAKLASKVINQETYRGKVKASVLVIGEFLDVVVEKNLPRQLLNDLADYIQDGKLEVCLFEQPRIGRYTYLSHKIRNADNRIGCTDVFIVAHSMTDIDCKGLLTFDRDILTSMGIPKVIDKHIQNRKHFRITDDPTTR